MWRVIFANVIRFSRLQFWVGYFIYFKLSLAFFYLTFLNVFFSSVKGINSLISKGMSKIYSNVPIAKKMMFSKLF